MKSHFLILFARSIFKLLKSQILILLKSIFKFIKSFMIILKKFIKFMESPFSDFQSLYFDLYQNGNPNALKYHHLIFSLLISK